MCNEEPHLSNLCMHCHINKRQEKEIRNVMLSSLIHTLCISHSVVDQHIKKKKIRNDKFLFLFLKTKIKYKINKNSNQSGITVLAHEV